ncbi:MAG: DUF6452 family protein, partial [Bacteroidota bacterium]
PLAVVLLNVLASCKDLEDHRIPYKSEVVFRFIPKKKNHLHITRIVYAGTQWAVNNSAKDFSWKLSLNPDADSVTLYVYHQTAGREQEATITVHYKRSPTLISPQCGAAQEYLLEKVDNTFGGKAKILDKHLHNFNPTKASSEPDVQIYF